MSYKNTTKLFASASLFFLMALLSSCGIWTDFTTYFNTYYNVKTLFDQTEEEILKQKKDLFAFREDPQLNVQSGVQTVQQPVVNQFNTQTNTQFSTQTGTQNRGMQTGPQLSGSLSQNLIKVIEKCSKILQYEKSSSYFPDALFITGKAFFYQQEYAKAQRKFLELASLGETKYSLENKLWLAKTYLQLRDFDQGLKLIEDVKADALKNNKEELYDDASITKVSFYIYREEYLKAAEECKNYLSVSKNDETNALVCFELGKIYLKLSDEENALQTFSSVQKYSPTTEVDFRSRLESCRLLKQLNRLDECETALNQLRYQGKFKNYLDEVLVELGQIYDDKNQPRLAIDLFLVVDSTYRQNPTSGIASSKIGGIYEKRYRDYDSSYKYYKKVAMSLAPREIKTESDKQVKNLEKYFQLKGELRDYDLKISYLEDRSKFMRDSIDYDIAYRQYQYETKSLTEGQQNQLNQNQTQQEQNNEFMQRQQALIQQNQNLKEKKVIPLATLIALGKAKKPNRPTISVDSINTLVAEDYYNLGNHFFSELNVSDSAAFYFKKILKDYPKKTVKVQTMYALGTYYQTIKDTVRADSLFKYIYDNYPHTPMGIAAADKLGLNKKEENKVVDKSTDPAEKFYIDAENKYFEKKYEAAIDSFRNVYKNYPASPYAPKAIYYIGLIYEYNLDNSDSAAAAYGMLAKDYLKSPLTNLVMEKYSNYKIEKDRAKKETETKQKEVEEKSKTTQIQNNTTQQTPDLLKQSKQQLPGQQELKNKTATTDTTKLKDFDDDRIKRKPSDLKPKTVVDTTKKKIPD